MESVAIDTCFRVTCYVLRVAVKVDTFTHYFTPRISEPC